MEEKCTVDRGMISIQFKSGFADTIEKLLYYELNDNSLKIIAENENGERFYDFYSTKNITKVIVTGRITEVWGYYNDKQR